MSTVIVPAILDLSNLPKVMMMKPACLLLAFQLLHVVSTSASPPVATCQDLKIPLNVTSKNVNIILPAPSNSLDMIGFTERYIALNAPTNISRDDFSGTKSITGQYEINSRLCAPASQDPSKASTVQFLIHGLGFGMNYWDFPLDPSNYSYVDAANKAGYTTFAIDRLGVGGSSKPDPIEAVQLASHIEIVKLLTERLREGTTGFSNVGKFEKVIHVGHSFGSLISNALVSTNPNISDALVLTGYSHNTTGIGSAFAALMFDIAKHVNPTNFSSLPNGYILPSGGEYGDILASYKVGGFDPAVAELALQITETATVGELLTLPMGIVAAPAFKGPVLAATGQNDLLFCAGACFGEGYLFIMGQEAQFYPASSNFTVFSPLNTGHAINLHFSALDDYAFINAWLESNGF